MTSFETDIVPADPPKTPNRSTSPSGACRRGRGRAVEATPDLADAELLDVEEVIEDEPVHGREPSPFDRSGRWYVVHTYAGYENKVKSNLASRVRSMNVEDRIFEVVIPMEDVIEIKNGRKVVVQKKVFPGYLLVRMDLDDDAGTSCATRRASPGSSAAAPSPPRSRARRSRTSSAPARRSKGPRPRRRCARGSSTRSREQVRVVTGPFADFNGVISEIDVDRSKLKVLVNIFGRETPVELGFADVAKL